MTNIFKGWLKKLKKNTVVTIKTAPFFCPVCKKKVQHFKKLDDYYFENLKKNQFKHPITDYETLNVTNYSCPHCGSSDRNRLYSLFFKQYFEKKTNISPYKLFFLDIAPDANLKEYIRKFSNVVYRSMDLFMEKVDDRVDITNMNIYSDEQFDFILCSHVLEHVEDDQKAISELFRILKKGKQAIIMVPILLNINQDIENPEWKSEEERWKNYGQGDHLRIYSKPGFISKLQHAGFKVNQLGKNYFGKTALVRHGIHEHSILYLVEK
jgi:SAM-dependent methyltransferase